MRYVKRTLLVIGVFLITAILGLLAALLIIIKGPSKRAGELMTLSLRETSALKWVPDIYLSKAQIDEIIRNNSVKETDGSTDTSLIDISGSDNAAAKDIETFEISGGTYIGDVMLIKDPSRVFIGNKGPYDGSGGTTVDHIAERYGAIAGINGGGFADNNGLGNGGTPDGFVISEGELVYGDRGTSYTSIGFTYDNVMVIGNLNAKEALDMGLRDCVCVRSSYAPVLILNGAEQEVSGAGGGLNPRTAIGQRADGTVIFVTVDGRQANSIGATFSDMIRIMSEYGAVNAASLDGGSSTQLVYNGLFLNTPYALSGAREVPNAFLVR